MLLEAIRFYFSINKSNSKGEKNRKHQEFRFEKNMRIVGILQVCFDDSFCVGNYFCQLGPIENFPVSYCWCRFGFPRQSYTIITVMFRIMK